MRPGRSSEISRYAAGALLAYGLLGLILGDARLIGGRYSLISGYWWTAALCAGIALCLLCAFRRSASPALRPEWCLLGYLLYLLSDAAARRFGFYSGSGARSEVLVLGCLTLGAFFTVCPAAELAKAAKRFFSWPLLAIAQCIVFLMFHRYARGRILFSDDHPSFLYRLQILTDHFPWLPFYNIDWNAGYSAREFFASGVLNVFALTAPYLYLWNDLHTCEGAAGYTTLVGYLFILIVPWAVYAAARLFHLSRSASVLAALLSLGPTNSYFEWLLSYGTLGFALSAALVPLTLGCAARLLIDERAPTLKNVAALLVTASLCLSWTLSIVAFLPLAAYALLRWRTLFTTKRLSMTALFIVLFLLLNGAWLLRFATEAQLLSFLSKDTLPGSTQSSFSIVGRHEPPKQLHGAPTMLAEALTVMKEFRALLFKVNPLLVLFAVPGILGLTRRTDKVVLAATIFWLLLLSALADEIKPQLELRRMIVPAAFLMTLPAAWALVSFAEALAQRCSGALVARRPAQALAPCCALILVFGGVLLSPVTAGAAWLNRSHEKFLFSSSVTKELAHALQTHGGEGRAFFLGFILHELEATSRTAQNGGHVAMLPQVTDKAMYASDFYHRKWSSVDPIPAEYRARGEAGIEEFLDLVAADTVITFSKEWAQYCQRSARYRQVAQSGRFRVFARASEAAGPFLRGEGEVRRGREGISVRLATTEAVIKYRWFPALKASDPTIELFPVAAFMEDLGGGQREAVEYIGIRRRSEQPMHEPVAISFHPERG